ncbi:MAG: DUF6122 family protein [Nanoarchaeota archaeon]
MPLLPFHLLADALLLGLIFLLDKELQRDYRTLTYVSLAVVSSNLIDIDHLLAQPIYDSKRCAINFHPLHSWYTFPLWVIGLLFRNRYIRYFCLGVLLHLWLDGINCLIL